MRWLTASLAHFVPGPASVDARGMTKRCTELALTGAYLRAWVRDGSLPVTPFDDEIDAWQSALGRHCAQPALLRRALEQPHQGLFHAQPYLWLRSGGFRSAAWEEALAALSNAAVRPTSIGLLHCLWRAGLLRRRPDWGRALARWLSAWGTHERGWDHDAYRVTHAAFYISDFGCQRAPVEPADRDRLVDLARRLLADAVARGRWDLAGELLVALTCLGEEDRCTRRAASAFRASRRAAAAVPDERCAGRPQERLDETFRAGYHTTIVDVLRCAVSARSDAGHGGAGSEPDAGAGAS